MIYKRRRTAKGKRDQFSYCPMVWIKDANGRHQHWGGSFRTKAEAKTEERRLLQERDAGAQLKPVKLTIAEVFDQYVTEKRNKVKSSTLQRSEELLAHFVPLIGSMQAALLQPVTISQAYKELQKRLSKRTVRHCHWQLHGALDLAVNWGQIPVNMASRVEPPEPDDFEGRALGQEEVQQLLSAIQETELAALVMLALDTGARQGELLALGLDDVDLENALIHIGRSVRRIAGQGMVFSSPKTRQSRRSVDISPLTVFRRCVPTELHSLRSA